VLPAWLHIALVAIINLSSLSEWKSYQTPIELSGKDSPYLKATFCSTLSAASAQLFCQTIKAAERVWTHPLSNRAADKWINTSLCVSVCKSSVGVAPKGICPLCWKRLLKKTACCISDSYNHCTAASMISELQEAKSMPGFPPKPYSDW